jgi:hypothetical protein
MDKARAWRGLIALGFVAAVTCCGHVAGCGGDVSSYRDPGDGGGGAGSAGAGGTAGLAGGGGTGGTVVDAGAGTALDGTYVAPIFLQTADKLVKMTFRFVWVVKQSGKLEQGDAKLGGTVHIDGFEARTKKSFSDAPISSQGQFGVEIQNMVFPKELNSALTGDVEKSVVSFKECRVADSCRFSCHVHVKLLDVPSFVGMLPQVDMDGDFTAFGTSPGCPPFDAGAADAEAGAADAKPEA